MLRSWSDPVVNAASFGLVHVKAESCVRWGVSCGGWSVLLPLRGPFHGKGESLPVRGSFRRHDASFARHGPREGRIVRGSRAEGESWPRPADPPGPRPTAPVEALSETTPTRRHDDAAARGNSSAPRRPGRAQSHRRGRGLLEDRLHDEPRRRSTGTTRSPAAQHRTRSRPPVPTRRRRRSPPPTRRSREASTPRHPPRGFAGPAGQYVGWLGSIWLTQATTPPPTCTASL